MSTAIAIANALVESLGASGLFPEGTEVIRRYELGLALVEFEALQVTVVIPPLGVHTERDGENTQEDIVKLQVALQRTVAAQREGGMTTHDVGECDAIVTLSEAVNTFVLQAALQIEPPQAATAAAFESQLLCTHRPDHLKKNIFTTVLEFTFSTLRSVE